MCLANKENVYVCVCVCVCVCIPCFTGEFDILGIYRIAGEMDESPGNKVNYISKIIRKGF